MCQLQLESSARYVSSSILRRKESLLNFILIWNYGIDCSPCFARNQEAEKYSVTVLFQGFKPVQKGACDSCSDLIFLQRDVRGMSTFPLQSVVTKLFAICQL